ncbi:hypothetical protein T08_1876 [Trichinella sp. T8]|nr:hypothetical protein T08_1876 [Trichinella sp. T8]
MDWSTQCNQSCFIRVAQISFSSLTSSTELPSGRSKRLDRPEGSSVEEKKKPRRGTKPSTHEVELRFVLALIVLINFAAWFYCVLVCLIVSVCKAEIGSIVI